MFDVETFIRKPLGLKRESIEHQVSQVMNTMLFLVDFKQLLT